MDKEWLEEAINAEAQLHFESKFESISFDNEQICQAYQALQKTSEWENFKKLMIKNYTKNIAQNIAHKIGKSTSRNVGEE